MKKYYFLLIFSFVLFSGVLALAQEDDPFASIVYPVAELGSCKDRTSCEDYCADPDNMEPCLNYAEAHDLMSQEDIDMGRKMLAAGETSGPGGCRGAAECGTYCDDMSHLKECLAFAEKNNLMPAEELEEAKKVAAALDKGIAPPPCNSKTECDQVCTQPENMKTCITFAKEAGLMPPEELEEAEKVLAALEKGIQPPPCGSKDKCDEYCSAPEHLDQCITFAEAAGFMSAEEAAMVRRTGGKGPGGCQGKEACEAYCDDPANMEPCINFAIENGFMSPEEAEQAQKMLAAGFTSGPGGCRGAEECDSYCNDISHMTECVDFAEKTGMMSAEDAARARKMAELGISGGPGGCKGEEECRSFCEDPANLDTCINFAVQIGDMSAEEADQARQGMRQMQEMEGRIRECLAMPCSEALTCLQSTQGGEGGEPEMGSEEGAAPGGGGGFGAEIQAKIEACMQEMQQQFQEGITPEGMMPPGGEIPVYDESLGGPPPFIPEGPSQEEIDKMIREETERRMQEEIQRQMEQQGAPAEQPPQSFFEQVKNFLASVAPFGN